jgi:hypothetical protein
MFIFLELVLTAVLIGYIMYQDRQLQFMRLAFVPYTVGVGENARRITINKDMIEYSKIADKWKVSVYTIGAIAINENASNLYSHGAMKIPAVSINEIPERWQAEACAKIISEVMLEYVYGDDVRLKEFYSRLGDRYCGHDEKYAEKLFKIHKELQNREAK